MLAEKGQDWVSHLILIPKGENTTPEFLAINPKGLVPVLIHDGELMIESIDIIDYLDQTFPPPLRPREAELQQRMDDWLRRADLKVLSHEFLFRAVRKISTADMENFEKNVANDHGCLVARRPEISHPSERLSPELWSRTTAGAPDRKALSYP